MGRINTIFGYVAASAFVLGLALGWKVRDWRCDAAYAKALQQSTKIKEKQTAIINDASQDYEDKRGKADVITVQRTNTIREIYRDFSAPAASCAAPDDARRLLESSVSDANAAATGKSGRAVSGSGDPS